MNITKLLPACLACLLLLAACEAHDCTLYNQVAMYGSFYRGGAPVTIDDTLTVTACGTDSVLVNRRVKASKLTLPLSYWQDADTLVLSVKGEDYLLRDTVWIRKTNHVHYESPDCPTKLFHDILGVECTHLFIDTITITRSPVNYDQTENLQIHLLPDTDLD